MTLHAYKNAALSVRAVTALACAAPAFAVGRVFEVEEYGIDALKG